MKTLICGIEIETSGQARRKVAGAIQTITGGWVDRAQDQTNDDPWDVIMPDGRRWQVMTGASLNASRDRQAEMVSPSSTEASFELYSLGACPAMVEGDKTSIPGEVYEIDAATLGRLDRLEGHPSFYERCVMRLLLLLTVSNPESRERPRARI